MEALDRLRAHAAGRIVEIAKAKRKGTKVIGMTPGGFIPEELIRAAGAIPLVLGKGGDPEPCLESLTYAPRFLCAFCRSQIGYLMMGEAAEYKLPDLMVVGITDVNIKVVADGYDYYAGIPSFRIGVPHERDANGVKYFKYHMENFKAKLEEVTGNKITDEALRQEIIDANKKRALLKEISFLRKGCEPVISSRDYITLHQLSFYSDKDVYLKALEEIRDELVEAHKNAAPAKHPRIMLVASTLAYGDRRIYEIMDETDAQI
ncbi:MAG: 2-hydroxyacyl-CoA dehydratase, partial [Coriobacteriales bacterium]|nr:2-hydroxyacyl-CoA dehydratase [Coriobacteriales bacterium]